MLAGYLRGNVISEDFGSGALLMREGSLIVVILVPVGWSRLWDGEVVKRALKGERSLRKVANFAAWRNINEVNP